MANTSYQSPVIAAPNLAAKKRAAYDALSVLVAHLREGTGGYTMDLISVDFGITTAQKITVVLTAPLPDQQQVDRYNLTLGP